MSSRSPGEENMEGALCYHYQGDIESDLSRLIFRIMDASETKKGVWHLVELLRQLIEWRGLTKISEDASIKELAQLATFHQRLHTVLHQDIMKVEKQALAELHCLIDCFLKGDLFFFIEPGGSHIISESYLVNKLLQGLPYQKEIIPHYPIVYISVIDCITTMHRVRFVSILQFLIACFFERSFFQLPQLQLNASWPSDTKDVELPPISRIACVIDLSQTPTCSTASAFICSIVSAVFDVLFVYAHVFLHAIVFHRPNFSSDCLWQWLNLNRKTLQLDDLLIFVTTSSDELDQLLKIRKYETTLGGFDDPRLFHYTCDMGKTVFERIHSECQVKNLFWKQCGKVRKHRENWLGKLLDKKNYYQLSKSGPQMFSSRIYKTSPGALDSVPTSRNLLEHLDSCYTRICRKLEKPEGLLNLSEDLEATQEEENIWSCDGVIPDFQAIEKRHKICNHVPSIRHTENVSRSSTRLCFWKGKNYNQLIYFQDS